MTKEEQLNNYRNIIETLKDIPTVSKRALDEYFNHINQNDINIQVQPFNEVVLDLKTIIFYKVGNDGNEMIEVKYYYNNMIKRYRPIIRKEGTLLKMKLISRSLEMLDKKIIKFLTDEMNLKLTSIIKKKNRK